MNALKYKLSNLETEDGRIRRKGELSEGQERQLQRNAEREEALKKTIVDLEEELYDKLHPQQAGKTKKRSVQQSVDYEDGEDDFFDRTKHQDNDGIGNEESEKTLVAKWKNLYQQQKHRKERTLPQAENHASSLASKLDKLQQSGDEEAFFVKNDWMLAKETLQKITAEQEKAHSTMTEIEKLLKIVNPKLFVDRETGYVGEGLPPVIAEPKTADASPRAMLPPPIRPGPKRSEPGSSDLGFMSMPPPVARKVPVPTSSSNDASPLEDSEEKNHSIMPPPMPPPKRKRVVGPSMPPPSAMATTSSFPTKSSAGMSPPPGRKPQGTLAFLATMTKPETENPPETKIVKPTARKPVIDVKKDEWRAPEGQDGSGMTKLNAKFAGRY